jgi:hypothetical protein
MCRSWPQWSAAAPRGAAGMEEGATANIYVLYSCAQLCTVVYSCVQHSRAQLCTVVHRTVVCSRARLVQWCHGGAWAHRAETRRRASQRPRPRSAPPPPVVRTPTQKGPGGQSQQVSVYICRPCQTSSRANLHTLIQFKSFLPMHRAGDTY